MANKPYYVETVDDLAKALALKLGISRDSVEFAKIQDFISKRVDENGCINEEINLVWKKNKITVEPMEKFINGRFMTNGYAIHSEKEQDLLFEKYSVTGFDNLLRSLADKFKLRRTDELFLEVKNYLKSLIPAGQTDLTGPCGLYIKKYPLYINAIASYSDILGTWATEYVVSCGDKRADLPTFDIS